MKKIITTSVLLSCTFLSSAQEINPFESIGKEGKILTLSNGKYTEVHVNDSLQRIGSVIVNMNTGIIYELLDTDTLYSEATLDPTVISRFYSLDPASTKYPGDSPYMFAGNNPIFYIDEDGKWKVRFRNNNDHSAGIVIVAEPGDNLQTLSIQMGIPYKELIDNNFGGNDFTLNAPLEGGEWLRQEDLPGVDAFQNINNYLAKENVELTNCANCAMFANNLETVNAWEGTDGGFNKHSGNSSTSMEQAANYLLKYFEPVSEGKSKIGDIITYKVKPEYAQDARAWAYNTYGSSIFDNDGKDGYSDEYWNMVQDKVNSSGVDHYSIILLKTKDGTSIQSIFEKPGVNPASISNSRSSSDFDESPAQNSKGESVIHTKK